MIYKSTDHGSDVNILFHDGCCVCYILKHYSHSQTAQKNSASLRSSIHSLRIRLTSYPCNTYEQITPCYLLSLVSIWTFCALRCSSWFFLARFGFSSSDVRCCFLLLFIAFCCFSLLFVARRCSFWLFIALDINHLPLVQNWCE